MPEPDQEGVVFGPTISTTEAARRLGVSNAYVQQLLAKGKLLGRRHHGARTVWRVDLGSLEEFARKRSTRPAGLFDNQRRADDDGADRRVAAAADNRAEMLELELVAARQELAELRNQLAREQMTVERLESQNRELSARLSSIATAHVTVVQSLVPPST